MALSKRINSGGSVPCARPRLLLLIAFFAAAIVGLVAISPGSLWIDEGGSAWKAIQPTFPQFWSAMLWEHNSNLQLPFYLCALWAWEKVAGSGEWALRSLNLVFLLVMVWGLWRAFSDNRLRFVMALSLLLSSAFTWFYLDQARPYAALLGASIFLFAAIKRIYEQENPDGKEIWFLVAGVLWISSVSMLAVIWAFFAVLALCVAKPLSFSLRMARQFPLQSTVLVAGLALLGGYYAWSIRIGTGTTPGRTGIATLADIVYEFFGFAGLGPSRNALREIRLDGLLPYLPAIAIFAAVWLLCILFFAAHRDLRLGKPGWKFYGTMLVPFPLLLVIADLHNTKLLARHVMPAFPLLIAAMSWILASLWSRSALGKALACALLAGSLVSSLEIRFAPRHQRDNYRAACAMAAEAIKQGERVYWVADIQTASYYGLLPLQFDLNGTDSFYTVNRPLNPSITMVFLSKPDLYDPGGVVSTYMEQHQFHQVRKLEAFTVWKRWQAGEALTGGRF